MKRYIGKYLILLGGLLALAPLSGCKLDDPVIPTEELYLRNFIKQYGLIDPNHDFTSAEQVTVNFKAPGRVSLLNVYAQVGDDFYRVGSFAGLDQLSKFQLDIPKGTKALKFDADGVVNYVSPLNTSEEITAEINYEGSGSVPDYSTEKAMWIDDSKFGKTAVKIDTNGKMYGDAVKTLSVDGKEYRYIDVTKAAYVGKISGKSDDDLQVGVPNRTNSDLEIGNTSKGSNVHFLINNEGYNIPNGEKDVLSSYKFTFRTASRNNANVRVLMLGKVDGESEVRVFMDSKNLIVKNNMKGNYQENTGSFDTGKEGDYTEWELRTDMLKKGTYEIIIMGVDAQANPELEQTCGNWGYMCIEYLKNAKDMRWILACEDLGATDDFDFNDVVFSIEAVNTNTAAIKLGLIDWQVIENIPGDNDGTVLHPYSRAASDVVSRDGENKYQTQLKVTALAAGGTLPIWLHFREETTKNNGIDYIVCPGDPSEPLKIASDDIAATEVTSDKNGSFLSKDCNEWHRWFDKQSNSTDMLNTGLSAYRKGKSVTFYTKNTFTLKDFCYLKFVTNDATGKYPYEEAEVYQKTDEWGKRVLQWKWVQENSQQITYGFFLTVYSPIVGDSQSAIKGKEAHLISKSLEGLPPQMFLIPDCSPSLESGHTDDYGWKWPCERRDITKVYPHFQTWVQNSFSAPNWYLFPKAGIVDKDQLLYPRDPEQQAKFPTFSLSGGTSSSSEE